MKEAWGTWETWGRAEGRAQWTWSCRAGWSEEGRLVGHGPAAHTRSQLLKEVLGPAQRACHRRVGTHRLHRLIGCSTLTCKDL